MYRRFRFEGPIHETLECVPLAVRRKLDLAGLKISLAGWQALPFAERLALCHLPVDTNEELVVYRQVLQGFSAAAHVELRVLADVRPEEWRGARPPASIDAHSEVATAWPKLDEEERYALVKLADPKRDTAKLVALMAELGYGEPVTATVSDGRCEPLRLS